MFNQLSFQNKILSILGGLSLLALTIMFIIAGNSSKALIEGKESQVLSSIDGIMDKIDRNLFERYGDVQAFSMSEPARSLDSKRINSFMNDMMGAYAPIYDLMFVVNSDGKVVSINTVDKAGKEIDVSDLASNDYSNTEWFKESMSGKIKAGTAYIKDLYVDEDVKKVYKNNGKALMFVSPILNPASGKVIGVWSNRMSWSDVVEAIVKEESVKIKSERIVSVFPFLYNAQGTFLFHPDGDDYVLKKKEEGFTPLTKAKPFNIASLQTQLAGFSGEVVEARAASRGYSTYPGLGWTAGLQVPVRDSKIVLNNWTKGIAFIMLLCANVFAYLFVRRQMVFFEKIISKLKLDSKNLQESSSQIAVDSVSLSEAATEQAAAIEETAASMEEMTSMLAQTTQNATMSLQVAEDGQGKAQRGRSVITRLSSAMVEISTSNAKLDGLVKLIEEIRNKTKVINDIVFETRLLSFNASIEAARAGAHGKGFAVVAEEVGKLASMSGKAADEIRTLLDSSTQEVTSVVKGTNQKVNEGQTVSVECQESFEGMGTALEKIAESVKLISSASKEQEIGVKQTNQAMNEMDQATQNNTRGADSLAGQAGTLSKCAVSLDESIQLLNALVTGSLQTQSSSVNGPGNIDLRNKIIQLANAQKKPKEFAATTPEQGKKPTRSSGRWKTAS